MSLFRRKLSYVFYTFFFLFNASYLVYNILEGFDWSKALIPFVLFCLCGWLLYAMWKQDKSTPSDE